jgi:hypothetical protein
MEIDIVSETWYSVCEIANGQGQKASDSNSWTLSYALYVGIASDWG